MANLDLIVENIKTESECGERGLYEHPKESRMPWENPSIGYKAINIRSEHSVIFEGTLSSGEVGSVSVDIREVHPEWKKISQKRVKQFFSEMEGLRGHKVHVARQNGGYTPDYDALRRYFQ
jgi:hypothetical protein